MVIIKDTGVLILYHIVLTLPLYRINVVILCYRDRNVPNIMINNTRNLFFKTAIGILVTSKVKVKVNGV